MPPEPNEGHERLSHSNTTFSQAALRLAQALDAEYDQGDGVGSLEQPGALRPRKGRNERGSARNSFDNPQDVHQDLNTVSHAAPSNTPGRQHQQELQQLSFSTLSHVVLPLLSLVYLWSIAAACYFVQVMWGVPGLHWRILSIIFLLLPIPAKAALLMAALHRSPAFSQFAATPLLRLAWPLQLPLMLILAPLLDLCSLTALHLMSLLVDFSQRPQPAAPAPRPAVPNPIIPPELVGFRMAHMEHRHVHQPHHQKQEPVAPRTAVGALAQLVRTPTWLQRQLLLTQHRAVMVLLRLLLQSLPLVGLQIAALVCAPGVSGTAGSTTDKAGVGQALAASAAAAAAAVVELGWMWYRSVRITSDAGKGRNQGSGCNQGSQGCLRSCSWFSAASQQLQQILTYQGGVVLSKKWRDKCEGKGGVFDLGSLGPQGDLQPLQAILAAVMLADHNHAGQLSITNTPPPPKRGSSCGAPAGMVLLAAQDSAFDALPLVLHALWAAAAGRHGIVGRQAGQGAAAFQSPASRACVGAAASRTAQNVNSSSACFPQAKQQAAAEHSVPAPTSNVPRVKVAFGVAAASVEPPAPWHVARTVAVLEPGWLVELGLGDVALTPDTVQALCSSLHTGRCGLEKLVLKDCGLTPTAVHSICSAAVQAGHLSDLDLSSNKLGAGHEYAGSTVVMDDVGEEDEEDIAAKARGCTAALALRGLLEGSCSLTRLSLAYTGMTSIDAGELLAGAAASPSLTHLDLSQNELDDVLPIGLVLPPLVPPLAPQLTSSSTLPHPRRSSSTHSLLAPAHSMMNVPPGGSGGSTGAQPRSPQLALSQAVGLERSSRALGAAQEGWGPNTATTADTCHLIRSPPLATLDLSFNWICDNLAGWLLLALETFPRLTHLALNHNNAPAGFQEQASFCGGPSLSRSASGRADLSARSPSPLLAQSRLAGVQQNQQPALTPAARRGMELVYHLRAHGLHDCGDLRLMQFQVLDLRGVQLPAEFLAPAPLTLTIRSDVLPGPRRVSSTSISVAELLDLPPSTKVSATLPTVDSRTSVTLNTAWDRDTAFENQADTPQAGVGGLGGAAGTGGAGLGPVGRVESYTREPSGLSVRFATVGGEGQGANEGQSVAVGGGGGGIGGDSGCSAVAGGAGAGASAAGPSAGVLSRGAQAVTQRVLETAASAASLPPTANQPAGPTPNPWDSTLPEAVRASLVVPGAVLDLGSGTWRSLTRAQRVAALYIFFASQRRVLLTNAAPAIRTSLTMQAVGSGRSTPSRTMSQTSSFAHAQLAASLPVGSSLQHAFSQAQSLLRRDSIQHVSQTLMAAERTPRMSERSSYRLSYQDVSSGFVSFAAQPLRNVWPVGAGVTLGDASRSSTATAGASQRPGAAADAQTSSNRLDPPLGNVFGAEIGRRQQSVPSEPLIKLPSAATATQPTVEGECEGYESEGKEGEEGDVEEGSGSMMIMRTSPDAPALLAAPVRAAPAAAAARQHSRVPQKLPLSGVLSGAAGVPSSADGRSWLRRPLGAEMAMGRDGASLELQRKAWLRATTMEVAQPSPRGGSSPAHCRASLDQRRSAAAGAPRGVLVVGSYEGGPILRVPLHALLLPLWAALAGRPSIASSPLPAAVSGEAHAALGVQQAVNGTLRSQTRADGPPSGPAANRQPALASIPSCADHSTQQLQAQLGAESSCLLAGAAHPSKSRSDACVQGSSAPAAPPACGNTVVAGGAAAAGQQAPPSPTSITRCLALDLHLMGVPEEQHAALGALLQLVHPLQLSAAEVLAQQQQQQINAKGVWRGGLGVAPVGVQDGNQRVGGDSRQVHAAAGSTMVHTRECQRQQ